MTFRTYTNPLPHCAADIAHEVLCDGISEGWQGYGNDLDAVRAILEPLGIRYVDDMRGTWRLCRKEAA